MNRWFKSNLADKKEYNSIMYDENEEEESELLEHYIEIGAVEIEGDDVSLAGIIKGSDNKKLNTKHTLIIESVG